MEQMTKQAFENRVERAFIDISNALYFAELTESQRFAIVAVLNRIAGALEKPRACEQNLAVSKAILGDFLNDK